MKTDTARSGDRRGAEPQRRQLTSRRQPNERPSGAWTVTTGREYRRISRGTREANPMPSPFGPVPPRTLVALIGSNPLTRAGLAGVLEGQPGLTVMAAAEDTYPGRFLTPGVTPEVALVSVPFDPASGPRLVDAILSASPETRVIVMDLPPDPERLVGFIQAGARGFVLKDATVDELVATIRTVADGGEVIPAGLTGAILKYVANLSSALCAANSKNAVRLTAREREVVGLIADGLANKEIARRLNLATYTVKSHVHNVLRKLGVNSRVQIATYAIQIREGPVAPLALRATAPPTARVLERARLAQESGGRDIIGHVI